LSFSGASILNFMDDVSVYQDFELPRIPQSLEESVTKLDKKFT